MQIVLYVKMQSQIRNTGSTSDHIQDMKMIALLHQDRRLLIQDKVQERNTQLNVGRNFLPVLFHKNDDSYCIITCQKSRWSNSYISNRYLQLSFLGKYYQTLSKAIWNNAGVIRGDRHVTELILKVIQSKSLSIMRILVVASYYTSSSKYWMTLLNVGWLTCNILPMSGLP